MFENTSQHIQLDKSSSTCVDFGLGRLSGFLRDFNFSVPSRVWYLLAFLAIQNLQRNLDRMCYSIHEQLQNLHKIPSDLRINRKQRPGHLLTSSFALSFPACCCAREANSSNWRKNRYTKKNTDLQYSPAPYPPPVNATSGIEQPTAGDGQLLEGLRAAALDHPLGVHGANPHGHQHRDVVDLVGSIPGQET